jgi:hypothetical protein
MSDKKIEKLEEIIAYYNLHSNIFVPRVRQGLIKLKKELQAIDSEPSPVESNFMQVKELTDEEWMELPKEEILQLYKNCYQMLQTMSNLSGEKFTNIPTMTTTGEPKTEIDSEEEKEGKLYQCPYSKATKCNLKDCCLECETFGEHQDDEFVKLYDTSPVESSAEEYLKKQHCFKPSEIREFRGDRLAEILEEFASQRVEREVTKGGNYTDDYGKYEIRD